MSATGYHRIIFKVLQYMLSFHNAEDTLVSDICPEIGVLFLNSKKDDICDEVKVFYQGHFEKLLDARCFVKTLGKEVNIIKELQLNVNGPCLIVNQVLGKMTKSYSFQYCSEVGWKLRTTEEPITNENKIPQQNITISIYVSLSSCFVENLYSSFLSFLKKLQLMMPYLTVVSSFNGLSYKRQGIQGLEQDYNWCNNVEMYLRTYSKSNNSVARKRKCKQEQVQPNASSQCSSFSIIYGSSVELDLGQKNHLHIFAFSENGIPLMLENAMWHNAMGPSFLQSHMFDIQAGPCAPDLNNVCYCLTSSGPSTCFFLLLLIRDESYLQLLLEEHGFLLASSIMKALEATYSAAMTYEREKKWSEIMATSIGSVIRFSTENEFRKQCLHLMEATDSMDAEVKLEQKLIHQLNL